MTKVRFLSDKGFCRTGEEHDLPDDRAAQLKTAGIVEYVVSEESAPAESKFTPSTKRNSDSGAK